MEEPKPEESVLTLVVSTDKGLCGATNNGLTRALLKQDMSRHSLVVWGDKGCGAFERSHYKDQVLFSAHPNQKTTLSFIEVSTVVDRLVSKKDYDVIRVVFNKMITSSSPAISYLYLPTQKKILAESKCFG